MKYTGIAFATLCAGCAGAGALLIQAGQLEIGAFAIGLAIGNMVIFAIERRWMLRLALKVTDFEIGLMDYLLEREAPRRRDELVAKLKRPN